MRKLTSVVLLAAILLIAGGVVVHRMVRADAREAGAVFSPPRGGSVPADRVELRELIDTGPTLRPSEKALSLDGKRVQVVGFMAEMEEPVRGGFFLVPRPISLDESGAGTGDLPLDSVLVLVPGTEGKVVPHLTGALEGVGTFEVGNQSNAEGQASNFRLRLDPDRRLAVALANSHE